MKDTLLLKGGRAFRLGSGITEDAERLLWVSLTDYLRLRKLFAVEIQLPESGPIEDVELRYSNLTPLGQEVVKCAINKWLGGVDSGKPMNDMSAFERCLKKHS